MLPVPMQFAQEEARIVQHEPMYRVLQKASQEEQAGDRLHRFPGKWERFGQVEQRARHEDFGAQHLQSDGESDAEQSVRDGPAGNLRGAFSACAERECKFSMRFDLAGEAREAGVDGEEAYCREEEE